MMQQPKTRGEYVALGFILVCTFAALGSFLYGLHHRASGQLMHYAYGVAGAIVFAIGVVSAVIWLERGQSKGRPEERTDERLLIGILAIGALALVLVLIAVIFPLSRDISLSAPYLMLFLILLSNVVLTWMVVRLWTRQPETTMGEIPADNAQRRWKRAARFMGLLGCVVSWLAFGLHLFRLVHYHYYAS